MVGERETANGHGFDLNCRMGPTTEATDDDKAGLLLDGNSGGASFGEGTSAEGLKIYKRRKRRNTISSDEITKTEFHETIKAADGTASDQGVHRLSFDAFPVRGGECSLRDCRNIVLQQMYQSLSGCEDGLGRCIQNALVTYPETGTSAIKESLDSVVKSDNQTHNSAEELSRVMSGGLLNQSGSCTISELCGRAFCDILLSDKFSELCALLLKNFGVANVNRILDIHAINMRMTNGAYETSPMLYLKDIQQAWTKLEQVGNEMVMLAKSLSDRSRAHHEQFVGKAEACQECGEKADAENCLVCDSCEEMYHLSCTEEVGTPKSWYCGRCVSNGIGCPHDNCVVCEKLVKGRNELGEEGGNGKGGMGEEESDCGSRICFICKSEVKRGEKFRTCGHCLCAHKLYHYRCLTNKQLGMSGPRWYCPSCLCRSCLVDKDDDMIVLCDACDQAYHIYCVSPQLDSIPKGSWFCGKCDRELKQIQTVKRKYEMQTNKVKVEEESGGSGSGSGSGSVVVVAQETNKSSSSGGGLDMLVSAAKTLSHEEMR